MIDSPNNAPDFLFYKLFYIEYLTLYRGLPILGSDRTPVPTSSDNHLPRRRSLEFRFGWTGDRYFTQTWRKGFSRTCSQLLLKSWSTTVLSDQGFIYLTKFQMSQVSFEVFSRVVRGWVGGGRERYQRSDGWEFGHGVDSSTLARPRSPPAAASVLRPVTSPPHPIRRGGLGEPPRTAVTPTGRGVLGRSTCPPGRTLTCVPGTTRPFLPRLLHKDSFHRPPPSTGLVGNHPPGSRPPLEGPGCLIRRIIVGSSAVL